MTLSLISPHLSEKQHSTTESNGKIDANDKNLHMEVDTAVLMEKFLQSEATKNGNDE